MFTSAPNLLEVGNQLVGVGTRKKQHVDENKNLNGESKLKEKLRR